MDTVIVQLPDDASSRLGASHRKPRLLHMGPGETRDFGRGTPGSALPITLPDPGVSRHAGRIEAAGDFWRLSNFSVTSTYVVENLEGAGEHVKVAPGHLGAPIPFEFSRVVLPALDGTVGFKVFAPQHAYAQGGAGPDHGERTVSPFSLDVTSKYFLVLVALCEPRLRTSSGVALPGAGEIVERLRPLESCRDLTRSAVNYHIDYLTTTKLRLRTTDEDGTEGARVGAKREDLVTIALRFDLVREEHLALLPSRTARPSRSAAGSTVSR
ncbi:serine/threonine protein kinase [Streptomyces fulvoviolaceus]|uniref:serine/threonine protein kinase n=1 Tax=Streptomyces fulvoviolaceus TaxID=285535 RepID=UPI0021C21CC5|nr:serine/threonine protein kinase [Streptomyces fulvoviolaceus]MCT9075680.1 serine/threonine protein kinase [Streptomyces fulvoviolaceus]